jgi:putative ABC transport system permease protein
MLMTIFGIAGCIALLLFGFAIGDSVHDLMPRQYEQTFFYDIMAVARDDDHEGLSEAVRTHRDTEEYADVMITSARISAISARSESLQLIVLEDNTDTHDYFSFRNRYGKELELKNDTVFVTLNAGSILGFSDSDTVTLQLADLQTADLKVSALVQNYLGNYVFMSRSCYERYFSDYTSNAMLVNLKEGADASAYAGILKEQPKMMSVLATDEMVEQFSMAFRLINAVVYIVILMSAALAFVVLFTLSSINVSERTREIATIKVLGFRAGETAAYVFKENLLLSVIGSILGLGGGIFLLKFVMSKIQVDMVWMSARLLPMSFVWSIVITLISTLLIDFILFFRLERINMAEALKSVE